MQKDIELLTATISTLFKAREYARDFRRLSAVKHLDGLIKDLQDFQERLKDKDYAKSSSWDD